jgi:hypothetical protein
VPRFFGSGDFDAQPYIVMEQIAGESLRSRFDQAPLPISEVVTSALKSRMLYRIYTGRM